MLQKQGVLSKGPTNYTHPAIICKEKLGIRPMKPLTSTLLYVLLWMPTYQFKNRKQFWESVNNQLQFIHHTNQNTHTLWFLRTTFYVNDRYEAGMHWSVFNKVSHAIYEKRAAVLFQT